VEAIAYTAMVAPVGSVGSCLHSAPVLLVHSAASTIVCYCEGAPATEAALNSLLGYWGNYQNDLIWIWLHFQQCIFREDGNATVGAFPIRAAKNKLLDNAGNWHSVFWDYSTVSNNNCFFRDCGSL